MFTAMFHRIKYSSTSWSIPIHSLNQFADLLNPIVLNGVLQK